MNLLPLSRLGARETSPGVFDFGLLLPWVSARDGNRLSVKIIHEADQFLQDIQPTSFAMAHSVDPAYGDYWSVHVAIDPSQRPTPRSAWGTPGRYVYRYLLENPNVSAPVDWIIDPFAREFGVGKLSAITLGYTPYVWSTHEASWKTPALEDLVIYELMITEFGGDVDGAIARLDYLADLGVNCLEVMPVSNVANTVDWGFLPIGHFGVDERFGKRKDLQRLIDAAHQRGLAVILDAVYGHASESFPYEYVYRKLGYHQNPFMGPFARDDFGPSTDFNRELTRDFFFTVNHHWLDCYHVDGFRYDCVPNYWDGPVGQGYARLVYETYQTVKGKRGATDHWQRFFQGPSINLVQCAEQLEGPQEIVQKTYSNCTWQNGTLGAAARVVRGERDAIVALGHGFGLVGYPAEVTSDGDRLGKSALQYLENHDHPRFVCHLGVDLSQNELLREGDRRLWYRVQPFLIGMFTARGIPMLWQGQEFGENYYLPPAGMGRVVMFRPVRWDYFYDEIGKRVITLVRTLTRLRRRESLIRRGNHFFYNHHDRYQSKGVMLFSRAEGQRFSLTALNFGDHEQTVPFAFPFSGNYREELHGQDNLTGIVAGADVWLTIPSNYGRVWTLEAAL
jgi:1,4-alpha-glucan branching enzyme